MAEDQRDAEESKKRQPAPFAVKATESGRRRARNGGTTRKQIFYSKTAASARSSAAGCERRPMKTRQRHSDKKDDGRQQDPKSERSQSRPAEQWRKEPDEETTKQCSRLVCQTPHNLEAAGGARSKRTGRTNRLQLQLSSTGCRRKR